MGRKGLGLVGWACDGSGLLGILEGWPVGAKGVAEPDRGRRPGTGRWGEIKMLSLGWVVVLALGTAMVGVGDRDADWVERRVEELQPTAEERRIDAIGWAEDIRSALRLAEEHGRPVFVFTMDGRFDIGRC